MSDWQVGDLAVCVDAEPKHHGSTGTLPSRSIGLVQGQIYAVAGYDPINGLFLDGLDHWEDDLWLPGFDERRFRKIRPDLHEDCEPEFVELLKKRKVSA